MCVFVVAPEFLFLFKSFSFIWKFYSNCKRVESLLPTLILLKPELCLEFNILCCIHFDSLYTGYIIHNICKCTGNKRDVNHNQMLRFYSFPWLSFFIVIHPKKRVVLWVWNIKACTLYIVYHEVFRFSFCFHFLYQLISCYLYRMIFWILIPIIFDKTKFIALKRPLHIVDNASFIHDSNKRIFIFIFIKPL